MSRYLFDGPEDSPYRIVLAHGAGVAMDSPFLNDFAEGLAQRGIRVARFEFPYMQVRRQTGRKLPPDRESVLREAWYRVIYRLGPEGLVIGGKSLGGRIASLLADDAGVGGLVCLGYPFHPPGKPGQLRVEHLERLRTRTQILQGERDPFGNRAEVEGYSLSPAIEVRWLPDGDHGFKPRKSSGRTERENRDQAIAAVAEFVTGLGK